MYILVVQTGDDPNLEHQKVLFTSPKKAQLQQMVQNGDVNKRATPTDGPKRRCLNSENDQLLLQHSSNIKFKHSSNIDDINLI
jgi:hypothetical protein